MTWSAADSEPAGALSTGTLSTFSAPILSLAVSARLMVCERVTSAWAASRAASGCPDPTRDINAEIESAVLTRASTAMSPRRETGEASSICRAIGLMADGPIRMSALAALSRTSSSADSRSGRRSGTEAAEATCERVSSTVRRKARVPVPSAAERALMTDGSRGANSPRMTAAAICVSGFTLFSRAQIFASIAFMARTPRARRPQTFENRVFEAGTSERLTGVPGADRKWPRKDTSEERSRKDANCEALKVILAVFPRSRLDDTSPGDPHHRSPPEQSQRLRPGEPPGRAGCRHRSLRVGKVVAGLRHALRGGAAPLHRVVLRLRAPVPRSDGSAGGGSDRRHSPGHRDRSDRPRAVEPLHRRHDDRDQRLHEAALPAHRFAALPGLRRKGDAGHSRRCGVAHLRVERGHHRGDRLPARGAEAVSYTHL